MIIQITMFRNEELFLKNLLPIWNKYVDGFIFLNDNSTDGSYEFLCENKKKYNILEIINSPLPRNDDTILVMETDLRQLLFDVALKYSNNIICLDADEYLDGSFSKNDLECLLKQFPNTVFHLKWLQYTSCNTIRIDGPWCNNYKDRIGTYSNKISFDSKYSHSTHLPLTLSQKIIDENDLFISHLQWIDKTHVAIKQYYWKVYDWIINRLCNVDVINKLAYDASVSDFIWEEEYTTYPLKIRADILSFVDPTDNYKWKFISEKTKQYNIPDLGDWNMNLLNLKPTTPTEQYKLSIITAVGNIEIYGGFINRYFENVCDQHFFLQTEHIIVYSEWSPLFDKFKTHKNFKFIKENENLGVYNAWNIGIQNSTSDFITNWNIDDLRHPINTKIKYDLLTKNPKYDVVYNYYVSSNDLHENFYNVDLTKKTYLLFPDEGEKYVMENCLLGPDPMWRKTLHDKVGYFDYKNFKSIGDWEMWIRFSKNGSKFKLIPEVLCMYFNHDNTVSNINFKNKSDIIQKQHLYNKYAK